MFTLPETNVFAPENRPLNFKGLVLPGANFPFRGDQTMQTYGDFFGISLTIAHIVWVGVIYGNPCVWFV